MGNEELKWRCIICNKIYKNRGNLVRHLCGAHHKRKYFSEACDCDMLTADDFADQGRMAEK